jgi:putative addiction module component (TIGR02574 family)
MTKLLASDLDEILRKAFALPAETRAMLADRLLESLDGADQKRIDALWAEEAERRMCEIEEGKVELMDGELVMDRLRARFSVTRL